MFAHAHRHTVPGAAVSRRPGLDILEGADRTLEAADRPGSGLECDGLNGAHIFVATVPLDELKWTALPAGEIACIERGERGERGERVC